MKVSKRLALGAAAVATVAFAVPSFAGNQQSHGTGTSDPTHCTDANGNLDATITYTPLNIWPPNHAMVPFTITYSDTDSDGDTATIQITGITQNQVDPVTGLEDVGAGNTPSDWDFDAAQHSVKDDGSPTDNTTTVGGHVRAERSGGAGDRIYTIHVMCTEFGGTGMDDLAENGPTSATARMGTADLTIKVPHDQGNN